MKWNRIANRESVAKKMKCTMENCCWLGFDLIYCNLKQRQQLQHTHTRTTTSTTTTKTTEKEGKQSWRMKSFEMPRGACNSRCSRWRDGNWFEFRSAKLTTTDNRQRQPTTTKATTKASNESDSDNDNDNNERECECEREWKAVSDGDVDADGRDAVSFAAKNSWQH